MTGVKQVRESVRKSVVGAREVREEFGERVKVLEERLIEQKSRSRRNNLIFHALCD